jgi:hypothetical protein
MRVGIWFNPDQYDYAENKNKICQYNDNHSPEDGEPFILNIP